MKNILIFFKSTKTALLSCALLLFSHHSLAETVKQQSEYDISLGLGIAHMPKYLGADKYEIRALPIINIKYRRLTVGGINGVSYDIIKNKGLKAGVSLGYFRGRDESDAKYLHGLGDIDSSASINTYLHQSFGSFYVAGNVARDFSDDVRGITAKLSTGYAYKISPQLMLNTNISVKWMNDDYAQAVFGVNQAQALASSLPVLTAKSGIESSSLSLTALYFIDRKWTLTALISATQLMGDAKNSPITRDDQPYMVMTGFSYRF